MFRRQENTLEADPKYPANLKELGYFIDNSSYGCIRNIDAPEQYFDFFHTNNNRHNQVRGEAMRTCQRREVLKRLSALGIKHLYLPALTYTKPNGPHVPILAPPAEVLKTRKRVIVIINDDCYQDLGVLAYRLLQRELGLNGGSVVNFVKEIIGRANPDPEFAKGLSKDGINVPDDEHTPGLIVLNNTQLLYSHKFNQALSIRSWNALPRKSVSHDEIAIHPEENRVEGHRNPQEHIKSVFDTVINNANFVAPDAEVYVIGIENGTENFMDVLSEHFEKYGSRVTAMAVISSLMNGSQISNPALKAFMHQRARQWKVAHNDAIDPAELTELPVDYVGAPPFISAPEEHQAINWLEKLSPSSMLLNYIRASADRLSSAVQSRSEQQDKPTDALEEPAKSSKDTAAATSSNTFLDSNPICPTFAGGDTWIGECVLAQPNVQQAVMNFFEEVAQDPANYRNPEFKLNNVPQPTPDNPLTLSAGDAAAEAATRDGLPAEMVSEEQPALDKAKAEVEEMRAALSVTPADNPALTAGLQGLRKRLVKKEADVLQLEKKALVSGSLKAGAAQQQRGKWASQRTGEQWEAKKTGPAIPFAGVQLDSEVVKGAGLTATVEEELEKLDIEG